MSRRRGVFIGLVLVAAMVGLLEPGLLRGETITGGILPTFYYPHFGALAERFALGELPRWDPLLGSGSPWFGPRGGGVVYPPNLLFALFPLPLGMAFYIAAHVLLAIEGARRWAARGSGDALSGLSTGLAYGLGGFLISLYWTPAWVVSGAWLAWAAYGGAVLARAPARGVMLAGASVAFCFLAGEPQGALMAALLTVGFARWEVSEQAPARRALYAALAVVIGMAAGGLTVVSTLHLLPETDRVLGSLGPDEFGLAPLPTLLDALLPGVVGMHADSRGGFWVERLGAKNLLCLVSIGTLGLAAVVASLESPRRRALYEGLALVALGALLAGVDAGRPLSLRFPSKWLVLSALGLARLVGLGMAVLRDGPGVWGPRALGALKVIGLLGGLGLTLFGGAFEEWVGRDAQRLVPQEARSAASFACWRAAVIAVLGLLLCAARVRRRLDRRALGALLLGLLLLDLLSAHKPLIRTTSTDILREPMLGDILEIEMERQGVLGQPVRFDPRGPALPVDYRLPIRLEGIERLEASELFYRDVLWANLGALHGVRTVSAFETSRPLARALLESTPAFKASSLAQRGALVDARYLLMGMQEYDELGRPEELVPVMAISPRIRGVGLVRNEACPPWAYVVQAGITVDELGAAVETLFRRPGWETLVIGPERPQRTPPLAGRPQATVRLDAFAAERIELTATLDVGGWLVIRETFHPDWRATVDGAPVDIARADALYRAVALPAGEHRVVMEYSPDWWWQAVLLTGLGWLALGAAGALAWRRRTDS